MNFEQLDVHRAKEIIDQGNVTIVDIRDGDSFKASHIADAVTVNDQNITDFLKTANKNKPLVCYCYHGISSQGAAEYFTQNGFKKVYSIEGGFELWRNHYAAVPQKV